MERGLADEFDRSGFVLEMMDPGLLCRDRLAANVFATDAFWYAWKLWLNFSMLKTTPRVFLLGTSALLTKAVEERKMNDENIHHESFLHTCGQIHLKPISAQRSHREEAHPRKTSEDAGSKTHMSVRSKCCWVTMDLWEPSALRTDLPSEKLAVGDGVGTTRTRTLCLFEAITYSYSFIWHKCLVETQQISRSTATKPSLTHNKFSGARLHQSLSSGVVEWRAPDFVPYVLSLIYTFALKLCKRALRYMSLRTLANTSWRNLRPSRQTQNGAWWACSLRISGFLEYEHWVDPGEAVWKPTKTNTVQRWSTSFVSCNC